MKPGDRVFVAGHNGLAGSAILRRLQSEGYDVITRNRSDLDLGDQAKVHAFLKETKPDTVVIAAAKVGGIQANVDHPADFICENVILEHNLIWGSHLAGVSELMFLASSCIYPRITPQPISEDAYLSGVLEPTNGPYSMAKIDGVNICESIQKQYGANYFTVVPSNLYGPHDNFNLLGANVFPGLIRKFYEAMNGGKPVEVWGSGQPRREFLLADDLADGVVFLLKKGGVQGFINVGTGISTSIRELSDAMQRITGYQGEIAWDSHRPDGFPEKTLDSSRVRAMGWSPKTTLDEGIAVTYKWYADNVESDQMRSGER